MVHWEKVEFGFEVPVHFGSKDSFFPSLLLEGSFSLMRKIWAVTKITVTKSDSLSLNGSHLCLRPHSSELIEISLAFLLVPLLTVPFSFTRSFKFALLPFFISSDFFLGHLLGFWPSHPHHFASLMTFLIAAIVWFYLL